LRLHHRLRLDEQHPHEVHDQHEFNNNGSQAFSASAPYRLMAVVSARVTKAPIVRARRARELVALRRVVSPMTRRRRPKHGLNSSLNRRVGLRGGIRQRLEIQIVHLDG
jgi:hypothetical protein